MSSIDYGSFQFLRSKGYPVPQISVSNNSERNSAGEVIGSNTVVSLEGFVCASGNEGYGGLIAKESGLRAAFKNDGGFLKISCTGASSTPATLITGVAKVNRYTIDKTNNYWLNTIGYTIELQIENPISGSNACFGYVTNTQDDWNIETIDENSFVNNPVGGSVLKQALNVPDGPGFPVYRVSRTISAAGKYIPSGSGAIAYAKDWVKCQASKSSIFSIVSGLELFNFTRSINMNEPDGTYRLTDNWLGVVSGSLSGKCVESYTAESSLDNSYLRTIVINGTIKGLEPFSGGSSVYDSLGTGVSGSISSGAVAHSTSRPSNTSKFNQALSGYANIKDQLFNRAQSFLAKDNDNNGVFKKFFNRNESPLNPVPFSITEGYNPSEGSVTYSWTFNNRPLNLISGSISESLSINDNFPTQQISEIFVLGRRLGPILQDLGTYTTATREVTFEVVMLRPTGLSGLKFPKAAYSAITGIIESFDPKYLMTSNCKSFIKNNTENWSVSEGRFVKTKGWAWAKCDDVASTNPNIGN